MKLYRITNGAVLERDGSFTAIRENWDTLIGRPDLRAWLERLDTSTYDVAGGPPAFPLAPVASQEVWAAGVTWHRSRSARMRESRETGGGTFYDRVYDAERPELFFKSQAWRVRGPGAPIRVRADAHWSVPEPELAAYANARGQIIGYTIGNDVSSRDIEGENPLYLPQAKIYDGSCALGPALLLADGPLPAGTTIELAIERAGRTVFEESTTLERMRRTPADLVEWLYRELVFPVGCVLLTGTGIVPPDDFTLRSGDTVTITIPPIGKLTNPVV
jgi:2-dehydro-3-deoxy-D-arabinonate dehydratase